jgi:hypothetical protein
MVMPLSTSPSLTIQLVLNWHIPCATRCWHSDGLYTIDNPAPTYSLWPKSLEVGGSGEGEPRAFDSFTFLNAAPALKLASDGLFLANPYLTALGLTFVWTPVVLANLAAAYSWSLGCLDSFISSNMEMVPYAFCYLQP